VVLPPVRRGKFTIVADDEVMARPMHPDRDLSLHYSTLLLLPSSYYYYYYCTETGVSMRSLGTRLWTSNRPLLQYYGVLPQR